MKIFSSTEVEILYDFEEPGDYLEDVKMIKDARGTDRKYCHASNLLKTLTLEMMHDLFKSTEWTEVSTNGS